MLIGITGSRSGPSAAQSDWYRQLIFDPTITSLVHGGARGVDERFHRITREIRGPLFPIYIYPGLDEFGENTCAVPRQAELTENTTFHDPAPYMRRNRYIVHDCMTLYGFPDNPREILRSGTWSAIRHARKINRNGWVINPDGTKVPLAIL